MRTKRKRPKALPNSVWGWIIPSFRYKQDAVVAMAGYDAAMYLRILAFGKFLALSPHCHQQSTHYGKFALYQRLAETITPPFGSQAQRPYGYLQDASCSSS